MIALGSLKSFNTQPPEGGWNTDLAEPYIPKGFNTQPPEGGWDTDITWFLFKVLFQHTAARRRLVLKKITKL